MKPLRLLLLVALVLGAFAGLQFLPVRDWFLAAESYIAGLGAIGPPAVALFYVLATVLGLPATPISITAAGLFGFKTGFIVVLFGANCGALCAFLLSRTILRQRVARWTEAKANFRALDGAVAHQGFTMTLLLRLSPVVPFNLLNYLLGLTPVRVGSYIAATLLGMLPGMLVNVYVGAVARDLVAEPAALQPLKYIGLLATIAAALLIARVARNSLRQAQELQNSPALASRFNPDAR